MKIETRTIKLNKMKREFNALIKASDTYEACAGNMEKVLQEKCDFDCGIENPPGDGLCVINTETNQLAQLYTCIKAIEKYGRLTEEMHRELCI